MRRSAHMAILGHPKKRKSENCTTIQLSAEQNRERHQSMAYLLDGSRLFREFGPRLSVLMFHASSPNLPIRLCPNRIC